MSAFHELKCFVFLIAEERKLHETQELRPPKVSKSAHACLEVQVTPFGGKQGHLSIHLLYRQQRQKHSRQQRDSQWL